MKKSLLCFPFLVAVALAQPPQPTPPPGQPQQAGPPQAPGPPQPATTPPPVVRPQRNLALRLVPRPALGPLEAGPRGRWWITETAKEIGLSADQQKKMDDIFQQHRLSLIDLNASLEKQELLLEPLVSSDQPDENKVLAQIDRVAQARAELEKANARMLLGIRRVMTADQWQKLKALSTPRREALPARPARRGGDPPPAN